MRVVVVVASQTAAALKAAAARSAAVALSLVALASVVAAALAAVALSAVVAVPRAVAQASPPTTSTCGPARGRSRPKISSAKGLGRAT